MAAMLTAGITRAEAKACSRLQKTGAREVSGDHGIQGLRDSGIKASKEYDAERLQNAG
jgi:hypothetical protein